MIGRGALLQPNSCPDCARAVMTIHHRLRRLLRSIFCATIACGLFAAPAVAQERPRLFQANQFRPQPSMTTNYFQVSAVRQLEGGDWEVGFVLNHAWKPLVVSSVGASGSTARVGSPITHLTTLDLIAAVGIVDAFEIGLGLPIYLFQAGEDFDVPDLTVPAPQAGLGDLRIVPRLRMWQSNNERWALGLSVDIAVPTGINREDFQTEGWRAEPRLALEFARDWWRIAGNVGWFFRPQTTVQNLQVDDTLTWGAAAEFEVIDGKLYLVPEYVSGASVLEPVNLEEVPMELRAGVKYYPLQELLVHAGVGFGLVEGFGTPDVRLWAGMSYSPAPVDTCARIYNEFPDGDDDLVCEVPLDDPSGLVCDFCRPRVNGDYPVPEDISAYAAADDALGYGVRYGYYPGRSTDDRVDEDNDGYADACDICAPVDACNPRLNTQDGLDTDGDGVPDGCDFCPDGNDLSDSDGDCISDCFDECPLRAEDFNNQEDEDGCPDGSEECICDASVTELAFTVSPLELFVALGGTEEEAYARAMPGVDITEPIAPFFFAYDIFDPVYAPEDPRIREAFERLVPMFALVDQIAATLMFSLCTNRVLIYGHTDSDGRSDYNDELSFNRASHVQGLLQAAGVPPEQTEIIPQGEGAVIFSDNQQNDYDPGNIINRRVVLQLACEDRPADPPLVPQPVCEPLTPVRCLEGTPVREPVWYAPLSVVD